MEPQHLKVKDKDQDISLTKNYCIIIIIQKNSSIHNFILKVQDIFGPHELKYQAHLKINEETFNFPEKKCPQNFAVTQNIVWVCSTSPKFRKNNDPIPKVTNTDGMAERQLEGKKTLFYRTLTATADISKIANP